jgi:shikimate kinase
MGAEPGTRSTPQPIIALIGPSGAGKSAVGKRLADTLGRPLIDTDEEIVLRQGRSIKEIFAEESETVFRGMEAEVVSSAAATPGAVVACGGGVVLQPGNIQALRSAGLVIYLKVSPKTAAARVGRGKGRPLLEGRPVERRLAELILERGPLYESAAHHVVDADAPPGKVAREITALIWSPDQMPVTSEP